MGMAKQKRRKLKPINVAIVIVLCLIVIGLSILGYMHYQATRNANDMQSVEKQVNTLYQDQEHTRLSSDISAEDINDVKENIHRLNDSTLKTELLSEIEITETLFLAYDAVNRLLIDHVIIDDVEEADISQMQTYLANAGAVRKAFLSTMEADTMNVLQQFHDIQEAKKKLNQYKQTDGTMQSNTITATDIQNLRNFISVVRNKKALQEFNTNINELEQQMTQQKEQQDEQLALRTKETYVVLDVPYISQTTAGAPQGCEAASLLMALRYKQPALDIGYYAFMDGIPVADDPNNGFVHSQYDNHPTDVPHTINPAPLALYGSNFGNVVDISGATPAQLRQEIFNQNPVVLYIVSGFQKPNWVTTPYGKDILNLHVVTLIGYNDTLQKYLINDPYYGTMWMDYATVDESYQTRSYAVSVR